MSVLIEGVDGKPLSDLTDITVEMRSGSTVVDVTEYLRSATADFEPLEAFMQQILNEPTSNLYQPLTAPGLYRLGCSSAVTTVAEPGPDDWEVRPFPEGTTLTAKRSGTVIATTSIGGKKPITLFESGILDGLDNMQPDPDLCNITVGSVSTADIQYCTFFSDVFSTIIKATGRSMHPSLAYFATIFPAVLIYAYIDDAYDIDFPGLFGPTSATASTAGSTDAMSLMLSEITKLNA